MAHVVREETDQFTSIDLLGIDELPVAVLNSPNYPESDPLIPSPIKSEKDQQNAVSELAFFISCTNINGNAASVSGRNSAHTFVRGALSMLSQSSAFASKVKQARSLAEASPNVAVQVHLGQEQADAHSMSDSDRVSESDNQGSQLLSCTEPQKNKCPNFSVGCWLRIPIQSCHDRQVMFRVVMLDENGSSHHRNAPIYGAAVTCMRDLLLSAKKGFPVKLPIDSSLEDGNAACCVQFVDIRPEKAILYHLRHPIIKFFRFYVQQSPQACSKDTPHPNRLTDGSMDTCVIDSSQTGLYASEQVAEVDYTLQVPIQMLSIYHSELASIRDQWYQRYTTARVINMQFENDAEALSYGYDVYRVQIITGRSLRNWKATERENSNKRRILGFGNLDGTSNHALGGIQPADTFLKAQGRANIVNMLRSPNKAQFDNGVEGAAEECARCHLNPFVVIHHGKGMHGTSYEIVVGRTNTEYSSSDPVWGQTTTPSKKPSLSKAHPGYCNSSSLPSHVEIAPENKLKQLKFYQKSYSEEEEERLSGWLRLELFDEQHTYIGGVESESIGEVILPVASILNHMEIKQCVLDSEDDSIGSVTCLTHLDWYDVRSNENDSFGGQIQVKVSVLLANCDKKQSLLTAKPNADCQNASSSHYLHQEMPLAFLYPHVRNVNQRLSQMATWIDTCSILASQGKTFKSSVDKQCPVLQALPTNLHVSYLQIGHNSDAKKEVTNVPIHDLLTFDTESAQAAQSDPKANIHVMVTCGAPTAHVMGLTDRGLCEIEVEMERLQGILDRHKTWTTKSIETSASCLLQEDAPRDYLFPSLTTLFSEENILEVNEHMEACDLEDLVAEDCKCDQEFNKQNWNPKISKRKPSLRLTAPRSWGNAELGVAAKKQTLSNKLRGVRRISPSKASNESKEVLFKYPSQRLDSEEPLGADGNIDKEYLFRVLCRQEILRLEYFSRKSVSVSQAVSTLVTSFVACLDLWLRQRQTKILDQMASIGFLIGWESLISSQGKELRMISDAWFAIRYLESFVFQLYSSSMDNYDDSLDQVHIDRSENACGYTIRVPVPTSLHDRLPQSLRQGQAIRITSVLFTQGINEMQSFANILGQSGVSLQSKVNSTSLRSIMKYYELFQTGGSDSLHRVEKTLKNLRLYVECEDASSKNTWILLHAADAVRSLNGGRVTYCKSGKDRTAMSVTIEEARLIVQSRQPNRTTDILEPTQVEEIKRIANILREFGSRIEIAKKNVGRAKYSFNSIQRKLLPAIYRPPLSTIQDMVTSVTERDS
uniref:Inositol3 putative n=1 Tax=Albugo laibachii Nc14 TaxID=890382 RepID=F0WN21_9STRA|nr:inositol3 putative [Albugo laibachii Nc14]|eukprot:CCA22708.1 inositol3 putative [Albugo laibachii Nc14]